MHKLCWKAIAVLAALISVLTFILGGSMLLGVIRQQQQLFVAGMDAAMDSGLAADAQAAIADGQDDAARAAALGTLAAARTEQMGLGADRSLYILSASNAGIVYPATMQTETIQVTPNLERAMQEHTKGADQPFFGRYMDYAYYLGGLDSDGYVLYVRDSCTTLNGILNRMLSIWGYAFLCGLGAAVLLGFLLTRPLVRPLKRLTVRAEKFARGEFDISTEPASRDEIGTLIRTFRHMGGVMNQTINQMTAEKHKIEIILEHVTNGIMAFDTQQNLLHINSAAKDLLQLQDTAAIRFDDFFQSLNADVCMAEFLYLERFKTEVRELCVGNEHIRAYFVPFKMDNDRTAGVVCVFEDFTEQFNLEEARQKFVAEVSHELKTPLTIIRTYTETLLNGYLDDKHTATSYLTTIEKETDKMTSLVSNLLTLSRFDVQKFEMHKEPLALDELLRGLVKTFSLEAEIEDIDLIYNQTTDIPQIYADRDQIERALKNILSNAIKYGEAGGKVRIFAGSLYNEVYVKVEDNGQGIKKEDLEHVFERFYRADKARNREKGGTGLGLSIAKEIIENHGGTIKIESEYMKYTRVTIHLPMAADA